MLRDYIKPERLAKQPNLNQTTYADSLVRKIDPQMDRRSYTVEDTIIKQKLINKWWDLYGGEEN